MKWKIKGLDAFSGGGGCTRGYYEGLVRANFDPYMTGIDRNYHPRYLTGGMGSRFIQGDAMRYLDDETFVRQFDFIHLSPPCQSFSPTRTMSPGKSDDHEDLLTPALGIIKAKYPDMLVIIENVPEAPMYSRINQILRLCASSFPGHTAWDERRLLHRHRNFRLHNFTVPKIHCQHNGFKPKGVYGALNSDVPGGGEIAASLSEGRKLMQINWMIWTELKEAIPPAYTDYIVTNGLATALTERAGLLW